MLFRSLVPYARNARTHSPAQVDKIAASIREFGFLNPIITDGQNGIVAGHGRVMAAQKLGLDTLPTIDAAHLTEAQRRAYVLADNRLALDAGWDNDLLRIELQDLDASGFDLSLTGFEIDEIAALDMLAEAEILPGEGDNPSTMSLADKFGIAPFSVLNAREGWWQNRKRAWLALGIKSEMGRGEHLIPNGGGQASRERYNSNGGGAEIWQRATDRGAGPELLPQQKQGGA